MSTQQRAKMNVEELARHIESFPAESDVDVYVSENGARFLNGSRRDHGGHEAEA